METIILSEKRTRLVSLVTHPTMRVSRSGTRIIYYNKCMTYNPELISFHATDGLELPGLLYKPEKTTDEVVVYLHGNGSSSIFYDPTFQNTVANYLNKSNVAYFPFNNRGAHLIKSFSRMENDEKVRDQYGTTYEVIKECIYDIDGAISMLQARGYSLIHLAGLSTGANKICVYDYYKHDNPVISYMLLSGGDDTGLYYSMLGGETFTAALLKARTKIDQGKGDELVPPVLAPFPLSYRSFYDTINPDGDYNIFPYNETMNHLNLSHKELFREFKHIEKPTHVIYGAVDEYCYGNVPGCVDILKSHTAGKKNFNYTIIPDAPHGFDEKESELATEIVAWITNLKR